MKSDVKSFYIILTIKIMLMNVLLNMRMFGLFSETSQEVTRCPRLFPFLASNRFAVDGIEFLRILLCSFFA